MSASDKKLIDIIAYCLLPDHFHLVLKQIEEKGISKFMAKLLHSYTKYFNTKMKRKGTLWEGRFKCICVDCEKELLYLIKFIHFDPVLLGIARSADRWKFSSFNEFAGNDCENKICNISEISGLSDISHRNLTREEFNEIIKIKNFLLEPIYNPDLSIFYQNT